jgi:hypothetical protein
VKAAYHFGSYQGGYRRQRNLLTPAMRDRISFNFSIVIVAQMYVNRLKFGVRRLEFGVCGRHCELGIILFKYSVSFANRSHVIARSALLYANILEC